MYSNDDYGSLFVAQKGERSEMQWDVYGMYKTNVRFVPCGLTTQN